MNACTKLDLCSPTSGQHGQPASLAPYGGQHRPAVGASTRDLTDAEDNAERLADFNAELERLCYGVRAGSGEL